MGIGMKSRSICILFFHIAYRIVNSFFLRTVFEPDEIWQNIEPIFYILFGKGKMTWDFLVGIRSFINILPYFIPHLLFSKTTSAYLKISYHITKITSGLIAGFSDVLIIKIATELGYSQSNISFLVLFSNGLWLYSPRSHINSLEMFFILLIFYKYVSANSEKQLKNIINTLTILSAITIYFRPTSIFFLIPLILSNFTLFFKQALVGITTLCMLISVDSAFYGEIVCPPVNFIRVNVLEDVSSLFGTQPWYSYLIFIHILTGFLPERIIIETFSCFRSRIDTIFRSFRHLFKRSLVGTYTKLCLFWLNVKSFPRRYHPDTSKTNEDPSIKEPSRPLKKSGGVNNYSGHKKDDEIEYTENLSRNIIKLERTSFFLKKPQDLLKLALCFFSKVYKNSLTIIINTIKILRELNISKKTILTLGWWIYFFGYTFIGHKEMRFIVPLIPFVLILSSKYELSKSLKLAYIVIFWVSIYIGLTHQTYYSTLQYVKNYSHKNFKILYAVCPYSLPVYSFFSHENFEIDHISSNPDISNNCKSLKIYKRFGLRINFQIYEKFLKKEFVPNFEYYDVILMYDTICSLYKDYIEDFVVVYRTKYCDFTNEQNKEKFINILMNTRVIGRQEDRQINSSVERLYVK